MAAAGKTPPVMRTVHKQPYVKWNRVWQNLHESRAPEEVRSAWYAVIHDILPTRERLAAINLRPTQPTADSAMQMTPGHTDLRNAGRGPPSGPGQRARSP